MRWAFVVVLLLAGCVAPSHQPATTPPGETPSTDASSTPPSTTMPEAVVFVLVENRYWVNRTSGNGGTYGDVGGHCDDADYSIEPLALDLIYRGSTGVPQRLPDPHAVVVRHYDTAASNAFMAVVGTGDTFHQVGLAGGRFNVTSSFHSQPTVLTVAFDGDRVIVNGTLVAQGSSLAHRFVTTWSETQDGQTTTFQSTERITVHNLGTVRETWTTAGYCI